MRRITIFNRREVFVTYDINKQSEVREKLVENNIDYVINSAILTPNLNRCNAEYKIYVHRRDDYEIII